MELKDNIKRLLHEMKDSSTNKGQFIKEDQEFDGSHKENDDEKDGDNEKNRNEDKVTGQYKRLQQILGNKLYNHAEIERRAFNKSDGTTRSLFKKKADRFKDEQGSVYTFDDDEISKIFAVIQNASVQSLQTIRQKDKE